MKKVMLLIALVINFSAYTQSDVLIAHYPLASTPNDTTGQSGPMVLQNTPFLEGGIYCNGIYEHSGLPNWCKAVTPELSATIFESLSVSAKFKVDSIGNPPSILETCVISVGDYSRWLACILKPDTTVALKYNNSNYQTSSSHFIMNTWNEFKITYTGTDSTTKLYLNDVLACSIQKNLIYATNFDNTLSVTDWSNGNAFRGFLKDLKIYTKAPISGIDSQPESSAFRLFPNPNDGRFNIEIETNPGIKIDLEIFNLIGEKVFTRENFNQQISNEIDLSEFQKGIYFVNIYDGVKIKTEKIMVL